MSRPEDGFSDPTQPGDPGEVGLRRRPSPDQPLRARWDPTDDRGRPRVDREAQPERKKQSALGRFVSTYGWRAYAIPVLLVLTVVLIVVTVKGNGAAEVDADTNPDPAARNTEVDKETTAIGAPTGIDLKAVSLPAGALPAGGPYTEAGEKSYHVVRGRGPQVGEGTVYTYTVDVEDGLDPRDFGGEPTFAKMVDMTLANPRSWIGDGKVAFRRIDSGEPDLRITLTSPATTRELCGYQIEIETSCYYPPLKRVFLNEARWVRGAISYEGDDLLYRQYLINHEVGHGIGYEQHVGCERNGALAPVMMQQSFGVANRDILALDPHLQADPAMACKPNPWPFPNNAG